MSILVTGSVAVVETLLVAVGGGIASLSFSGTGAETNKGLSFFAVYVLLPCLLFYQLSLQFSLTLLQEAYPLIVSGTVRIFLGLAIGTLLNWTGAVPKSYRPLVLLGCGTLNAVGLPVSMTSNLDSVAWMNPRQVVNLPATASAAASTTTPLNYIQVLIFVFSIPINFSLWSIGNFVVRNAAIERDRRRGERARRQQIVDASAGPAATGANADAHSASGHPQSGSMWARVWANYVAPSLSPPFIATWVGIACAVLPGVQPALQDVLALRAFMGACKTAGAAAVPLAIIVLGVSLMRSILHGGAAADAGMDDEEEDDEAGCGVLAHVFASNDLSRRISKILGVPVSFVLAVSSIQLLIVPLVTYLGVTYLYRADFRHFAAAAAAGAELDDYYQRRRLMLFVLFVEGMPPTAMNASIICTLHNYRNAEFARLLLVQYITAALTMAGWLSLFIATASGSFVVF
jgi:predicted permease